MNSTSEELESLLFDWDAGALDAVGVERLREILKTEPEAAAVFVRQQMLSAALKLEGDAGLRPADAAADTVLSGQMSATAPVRHRIFRMSIPAVAAIALLIAVLAGRILFLELSDRDRRSELTRPDAADRGRSAEATSRGIALITRLVDISWSDDQAPLDVGDALAPGRLAIRSGYAQVEFFCGATVVLEGPAELELRTPTLARVVSGRLRAQVPPAARGFSLEVADMTVVDLGTEFGLSVTAEGADVQVFDGEVEVQHPDRKRQRLTAGQGVVLDADGGLNESQADSEQFLDIATLESRVDGQRAARYERWRMQSQQLRQDPRLIAYYAFDSPGGWKRKLSSSMQPEDLELDGAIVGARRVAGRWSAKSALEFKRPGDRVRVQIPGEYSSLSFLCWVKIDSLDRWYNSLFLTDNYNQGEPHWQILDSGQLFFSVCVRGADGKGPEHREVLSPPFWNPTLSGKWLHLATTYDVDAQCVTHFLNGTQLHQEQIPDYQLVRTTRFGRATMGNWSSPQRPDADFAIRNLNGSIDEFALFSVALTAEEIKVIYENGTP